MTRYHPFYCEENIWHLCAEVPESSRVCIVTNAGRSVAMWLQRAGAPSDGFVVWDYHVVLLVPGAAEWMVHDLDTLLDCPSPLPVWLGGSFVGTDLVDARYAPLFRLVSADEYRAQLTSDRSHMRDADGGWRAPPPSWPPIHAPGRRLPLTRLLEVGAEEPGQVLDLEGLRRLAAPVPA